MNKKRLAGFIALVLVITICAAVFVRIMFGNSGAANVALTEPSMYNKTTPGAYGLGAPSLVQEKVRDSGIAIPSESTPIVNINPEDRKIVKNGSISILVKNVDETAKQIYDKAISLGGYTSGSNFYNSGKNESKAGYIRLRIPVDKVDEFIKSVKVLAISVQNETINSNDVTSDFIDLQAIIKNLEVSETQLQGLMNKAGKVSEVLEVQRELTNTRTQIEQLKGQLKYLEGSSALSDITVNIAIDSGELPIPPEDKWQPATIFRIALRELITLGRNVSYLAIYLLVFSVIWVPLGFGLKWLYKFLRRRIQ